MPDWLKTRPTSKVQTRWVIAATLCVVSVLAFAQGHTETPAAGITAPQQSDGSLVVRTGSSRQTWQSWLNLSREFENTWQKHAQEAGWATSSRLRAIGFRVRELLDLSEVPATLRREAGANAALALADILNRVELPPIEDVPEWDPFDESAPATWRVPGTPITISRMDQGARAGEFLFSASTVAAAPRFYERIRHLPLTRPSPFESWTDEGRHLTGPLFPATLIGAIPEFLKKSILDTPIWKILTSMVALGLATGLLAFTHRWIRGRRPKSQLATYLRRMLAPLAGIALAWALWFFVQFEVNVSGAFAKLADSTFSVIYTVASAWLCWLAVRAVFEWMILSPRIPDESLNANLMRLSARLLGFLGIVLILALGAHDLGIPVLGVVAGLGFGGLAVALAIRPTLENLVGGVILFTDKPVRVGDFCTFGNHTGTVESIGIRSTQIRALDRTLISVPNATFVNLELINWARCDKMLILAVIGLRYETEPDQLRQLLARLREMLYAHPKIDRETVRVRYVGYGPSSRDVQLRVYALTQEWNEFHAIREDVFLRVDSIVTESGTSFAFPSQTLYLGRDGGLDNELTEAAKQQVADWRRTGILPFPDPAAARIDDLAGTLDYPPRGSVEEMRPGAGEATEGERLSELPAPDELDDDETTHKR